MEDNLAETAEVAVTAGDLSVDVLADIFGYLDGPKDIMRKRRVNKRWKEAATKTVVPPTEFCVNSVENYNAMNVMTRALPTLQQITLRRLGYRHKWSDGGDPDERRAARTADWPTNDIEIVSNFRKLRILEINFAGLNGRYPFLFNNFPLLQKLSIDYCNDLKWDLEMLAGFPLLKELMCYNDREDNNCVTGNINSLRVLKDTLEKVAIEYCPGVEGNFMDLADFPHLRLLHLNRTAVTGDIRDINANDFSSLELLSLPKGVYGGNGYEFQRISDAPDLIRTLYLFYKQRPSLIDIDNWYGQLSRDSPDWYDAEDEDTPPFFISFVEAGSRLGYRWDTCHGGMPCRVNWLDSKPERVSSGYAGYAKYMEDLEVIHSQETFYRGFHQPPTEEEYRRLMGWESENES
jgi:hypothetical protein